MDEGSTSSEDEELVNVRSHKRNMETKKKKGKKKLATETSTEVMHHEVGYICWPLRYQLRLRIMRSAIFVIHSQHN